MRRYPKGFGGDRVQTDKIKRDGWQQQGVLVIAADDPRLFWPEREFVRQLGTRLYGKMWGDNEKTTAR